MRLQSRALHFPRVRSSDSYTRVCSIMINTRSCLLWYTHILLTSCIDGVLPPPSLQPSRVSRKLKINDEPNHFCFYSVKSLNSVSSTHPAYDAGHLRPLDHQTEDTPSRLVGQIGEVGRWDSWEAVGALLTGTNTRLTRARQTRRMHRRFEYLRVAKDSSSSSLSSLHLLGLVDVFALHSGHVTMAGFYTHTYVFMC